MLRLILPLGVGDMDDPTTLRGMSGKLIEFAW
jgi:hypothetical protein